MERVAVGEDFPEAPVLVDGLEDQVALVDEDAVGVARLPVDAQSNGRRQDAGQEDAAAHVLVVRQVVGGAAAVERVDSDCHMLFLGCRVW